MAKKSKTQRAKASAARAQRKAQAREVEASAASSGAKEAAEAQKPKRTFFKKASKEPAETKAVAKAPAQEKKPEKKAEAKPVKKKRFQFLRDVRSEMKRVTWPTKQDVLRWSVVVVAALVFFGVYVALLDNVVITPLLVAISGLGLGV